MCDRPVGGDERGCGAAGASFGGIITQERGWRWVLLINLPIGIVTALVADERSLTARRARFAPVSTSAVLLCLRAG